MNNRTLAKPKHNNSTTFSLVFGKKLLSRSFMPQSANEARDVSYQRFGHNFSDVQVESPSFKQSSPLFMSGPGRGAYHTCPPRVQAKLKIGQPDDKYEQEADRVAEQVMRMPEPQAQRKKYSSPDCKEEDEDKILQAKSVGGVRNARALVDHPAIQNVLPSPGQPLDAATRSFMEPRFGQDFNGVQVHVGSEAAESARAVNARAYTVGRNVVFGTGEYSPNSYSGRKLFAHELTHVVQQNHDQQSSLAPSVIKRKEPSTIGSDAAGKTQESITGEAFIKGATDKLDVDPNDVEQGSLGDCWLLAGLQAVAAANPQAVRDMIKPLKGGKWQVTFYFPGVLYGFNKETVIVDAKVPVSSKGGSPLFAKTGDIKGAKKELWVLLIEKAYAKTQGSYLKIEGDKHPQKHKVLEMITGKGQQEIYPNKMKANDVLARFAAALKAKKAVTLASIKGSHAKAPLAGANNPKIITDHGYSLIKVDTKARTVDLRNPWGDKYNALGLSIDDLVRFFRRARISG